MTLLRPASGMSWRDRLARVLCNWILRHVATDWYEDWTNGLLRYGMNAAARDLREDRDPPKHWLEYR